MKNLRVAGLCVAIPEELSCRSMTGRARVTLGIGIEPRMRV